MNSVEIEFPSQFINYDIKTQENVKKYLNQLKPIQIKAYMIAKQHLGSSFDVLKSNGYIHWVKNNK
jgi:competence protein ComGC